LLFALLAYTVNDHIDLGGGVTTGKLNRRNMGIVEAGGFTADLADEMNVIIVVMTLRAILPAQGITGGIICCRDGVDDPVVNKSLECTVNGNPVKPVTGDLFNIVMRQCIIRLQENLQDRPPAVRITQAVLFQY